ncbi:MAG: hypothetical protein ABSA30_00035 [Candidatus Aminicenantales bacterium]|jgi:hypothetical protein
MFAPYGDVSPGNLIKKTVAPSPQIGVDVTVQGDDELRNLLRSISYWGTGGGKSLLPSLRQALKEAGRIGRDELKQEARNHVGIRVNVRQLRRRVAGDKRGHLYQTAVAVARHYNAQGIEYIAVGFEWPKGAAGWLVEHGHRMVVGGTVQRLHGSGKTPKAKQPGLTGAGQVVGFVKPYPIAAPAFQRARPLMEDAFMSVMKSAVTAL